MYRFEKLYVDLVTSDLTVLIAYLTRTHLFGATIPQGAIEVYRPDGRRESYRATVSSSQVDRALSGNAECMTFRVPEGRLDLMIRQWDNRWTARPKSVAPGLSWSVVTARAPVVAQWFETPVPRTLAGTGYADHITMNRFFRRLDIEQVDWGRIHLREATIVFNGVRFRTGQEWKIASVFSSEMGIESFERFELIQTGDRVHIRLPICDLTATIDRVLHDGPALDRDRFPGNLERIAVQLTVGPLQETRFISRVQGELYGSPVDGTMLHERVVSGAGSKSNGSVETKAQGIENGYAEQSVGGAPP